MTLPGGLVLIHNQGHFWVIVSNSLHWGHSIITERQIFLVFHFFNLFLLFMALLPLCLSTLLSYFSFHHPFCPCHFLTFRREMSSLLYSYSRKDLSLSFFFKSEASGRENSSLFIQLF